ncbi:aminoglycoside phosphotransferase family protein [Bosea sp. (in: a-proteobacteria)]|uniref:aminoglycoside phosphotransferase family protein n=1 Tax=Bosea sp. (in: a-proteobacteria) TaxID=1871050 RepID=UPI00342EF159
MAASPGASLAARHSCPSSHGPAGEGYPFAWSVCRWIPGEDAHRGPISDRNGAALTLARFIQALQAIDPSEGPRSGSAGVERGVPLLERDERVRQAIAALAGDIDVVAVTRAWDAALAAPPWRGPPVWLHGDLHPGNLLLRNGALVAVIDFGGLGVGDPACDLLPAWTLFSASERRSFREQLACDEAGWARGKGWALSIALIAWPYYRDTNPGIVDMARRTIERVLADAGSR